MKALIQRVNKACVEVEGIVVSKIDKGILLFLGVEKNDINSDINYIAEKVVNLRIFEDENEKMNLSLLEAQGELLIVSQFTLAANTKKGRRPGFDNAMNPDKAESFYKEFINYIDEKYKIICKTGVFGKHMNISLINDGPVTFLLESMKK
ncbi:MAG: D-aminoacyl-tRNA deacylase [Candidatus Muirbacterium halophilum]|nr:D-aminoacyl-tRNA deacylase [Candidatus Muirbacterium halophilum]